MPRTADIALRNCDAAAARLASGGVAVSRGRRGPIGMRDRNRIIVKLVADGVRLLDVGAAFGISRPRVSQIVNRFDRTLVADVREARARLRLEAAGDRFLAWYDAGLTCREIGCRLRVNAASVCEALKAHPDYRPRRGVYPRWRIMPIAVPAWVLAEHYDRYRRIASSNGEEAAAACLRRLKRLEAGLP